MVEFYLPWVPFIDGIERSPHAALVDPEFTLERRLVALFRTVARDELQHDQGRDSLVPHDIGAADPSVPQRLDARQQEPVWCFAALQWRLGYVPPVDATV